MRRHVIHTEPRNTMKHSVSYSDNLILKFNVSVSMEIVFIQSMCMCDPCLYILMAMFFCSSVCLCVYLFILPAHTHTHVFVYDIALKCCAYIILCICANIYDICVCVCARVCVCVRFYSERK